MTAITGEMVSYLRNDATDCQCTHCNKIREIADTLERLTNEVEEKRRINVELFDEVVLRKKRIAELEQRLNDFTDPNTPGMVSVGLLNTETETSTRLRSENDSLRARVQELEAKDVLRESQWDAQVKLYQSELAGIKGRLSKLEGTTVQVVRRRLR